MPIQAASLSADRLAEFIRALCPKTHGPLVKALTAFVVALVIQTSGLMDDGWLDVCIIKQVPRWTVLRMLVALFWGGHTSHRAVEIHRTKTLTIHTEPPVLLCADGERICHTPATIEIIERGLSVLVPADEPSP